MLDFNRNGPGIVSTSKLRLAQVLPAPFENPAQGGYCSLKDGAWFRSLNNVPMANGGKTDLTRFPARKGFDDLVMLHHKDADDFAWAAVVFPEKKFVWFSLKNPPHLASTVLWHSHGGRHYAPWNGRHCGVLGVEDVTTYFHLGLGASLEDNPWKKKACPPRSPSPKASPRAFPTSWASPPCLPDSIRSAASSARPPASASTAAAAHIDHAVDTTFLQ
jgi:hypothetical protein